MNTALGVIKYFVGGTVSALSIIMATQANPTAVEKHHLLAASMPGAFAALAVLIRDAEHRAIPDEWASGTSNAISDMDARIRATSQQAIENERQLAEIRSITVELKPVMSEPVRHESETVYLGKGFD